MTFPSDGSFVPVFTGPDNATRESDPKAATSAIESIDDESVAAGGNMYYKLLQAGVTRSPAGEVECLLDVWLTSF